MTTMRLAIALLLVLAAGCSNKMEQKECDKLRGDAFELLNKGQQCNTDADCKQSDWPGCAKPESNATADKIGPMAASYKKGQCDEPKIDCREPPPVYCKQGLCVHREKGTPEGAGNTPSDQIIIQ
jgi:outer membrane murein-binding lipoprotein Lpp